MAGRPVSVEPLPATPPMPWERAAPDGRHYVSFATWMCPVNCIEPERCPETRDTRWWSMPPALESFVAGQQGVLDGSFIFHCTHRRFGVGMIDAQRIAAADEALAAAVDDAPKRFLVGTVSHCHGALGVLAVPGNPLTLRSWHEPQHHDTFHPDVPARTTALTTAPDMTETRPENIVIIGSGPAAWTAAVYAARANLRPLVFEGEPVGTELPGGQLMLTTEIENYPGFPEAITGPELMDRMKAQAVRYGTRVVSELVRSVDLLSQPFVVTPNYSAPITAHTVVVATGAAAKWIGLPDELRLAQSGGGVSACAVCDGAIPFYRNKVLGVVGGGDTAMEEAMYLTKFASEVVVIHRRDHFRASKVMARRVLGHPKIRVIWNSEVSRVLGDDVITGVELTDTQTGEKSVLELGGLFVAIGHVPNTRFLDGQLELTPSGYVKVQGWRTATSVPGVFAAGDVIDEYYRQAITSAGTGCMAALEAERWLGHEGLDEMPGTEMAEVLAQAVGDHI